jgi:hypothetical protein
MTGADRKGQSEDFNPASKSRSCRRRHQETSGVLRELSQPPPTNGTENVFTAAAIQIQKPLLRSSKCHPRLPPKSISRSRRPLPLTPKSFTKRYTTTRPARQRPSITTHLARLLTQLPSPQTPIPSRPTVPNRRPSKATPSPLTQTRLTVQLPSATIPASCDPYSPRSKRRNHVQQTTHYRHWL